MHNRIVAACSPLFSDAGAGAAAGAGAGADGAAVTLADVETAAGITGAQFAREFSSLDDLAEACMVFREQLWAITSVEAAARDLGSTPEGRLLAIFDVFDDWFHREDTEALAFMNVMMQVVKAPARGRARAEFVLRLTDALDGLAGQAHLRQVDEFVFSWRVLLTGSIFNAAEGDPRAASRAREMGRELIARHEPPIVPYAISPSEFDLGGALGSALGGAFGGPLDAVEPGSFEIDGFSDAER
jgi:AcrR family transcriptional regulator